MDLFTTIREVQHKIHCSFSRSKMVEYDIYHPMEVRQEVTYMTTSLPTTWVIRGWCSRSKQISRIIWLPWNRRKAPKTTPCFTTSIIPAQPDPQDTHKTTSLHPIQQWPGLMAKTLTSE